LLPCRAVDSRASPTEASRGGISGLQEKQTVVEVDLKSTLSSFDKPSSTAFRAREVTVIVGVCAALLAALALASSFILSRRGKKNSSRMDGERRGDGGKEHDRRPASSVTSVVAR